MNLVDLKAASRGLSKTVSPFVIRVNLPQFKPSLFRFTLSLSFWRFSIILRIFFFLQYRAVFSSRNGR